jgi:Cu/Ag efflux protein CusF
MKKTMAGLAGAMLALTSANVLAQTTGSSRTQDTTQMRQNQKSTDTAQGDTAQSNIPVAGVVTSIDKKSNTVTIVTPASTNVDMTKWGKSLVTEEETNLISIKAPLSQGAPLLRDGKSAKLGDIKEGDVVRTSFDPNAMSFTGINAVSQRQIDKDINQAQKELKREVKTMEKTGKQMNE